jgi:hypothetical protein
MDTTQLNSESPFSNPAGGAKDAAASYIRALLELLGDQDPVVVQAELPDAIDRAVSGLSDFQLRQPEKPGKWSIIQVVQHLADSEIVYGYRIRMILAHDVPKIEGYDQDLWATQLRYAEVPLDGALRQLGTLREANLRLIRGLSPAELDRAGMHSERGPETVRRVTELLAGHDILHRRQIDRIKRAIGAG